MKKITKFNFLIDVFLFLVMAGIGGIGLLLKYRLVSGEERWVIYGSNPDLFLWGWDRHQWGDLHLYLGYVFWGLLVFHIVLHWRQITGIFRKLIPSRAGQAFLVSGFVLVSLLLLAFAFISPIEVAGDREGGGRHRSQTEIRIPDGADSLAGDLGGTQDPAPESFPETNRFSRLASRESGASGAEPVDHQERTLDIDGTKTIAEVSSRYGIPPEVLKQGLGLSSDIPDGERLGRLRRRYGFHMSDVEKIVLEYGGADQ